MRYCMPLSRMLLRHSSTDESHHVFGKKLRNGNTKAHQGWDLLADLNSPVFAIADGTVTYGYSTSGYGNWVQLRFTTADGSVRYAFYAHLQPASFSRAGQVSQGGTLGFVGRSGNAGGPGIPTHLHFEIRTVPHPGSGVGGREDPGRVLGLTPVCGFM